MLHYVSHDHVLRWFNILSSMYTNKYRSRRFQEQWFSKNYCLMGSTEELRLIYIAPKRRNGQQRLGLIYVLVIEPNRQLWYICVIILKSKLMLLWRWEHEIFAKVTPTIGFISSEHLSMCVIASITWFIFFFNLLLDYTGALRKLYPI